MKFFASLILLLYCLHSFSCNTPPPLLQDSTPDLCLIFKNDYVLTAHGKSLKWYADKSLTNYIGTGNVPLPSYIEQEGFYSFYVTQTVDNCESKASELKIHIFDCYQCFTPPPFVKNEKFCFGQPDITLFSDGVNVKWYSGMMLLGTGNEFKPWFDKPGEFGFSVTQTNGCESMPVNILVKVEQCECNLPPPPKFDTTICRNDLSEIDSSYIHKLFDLNKVAKWYYDPMLKEEIDFRKLTLPDQDGMFYFYSMSFNSFCKSQIEESRLFINKSPAPPDFSTSRRNYCLGETITVDAVGENIKWTNDNNITISTGNQINIFPPLSSSYSIKAFQEKAGCKSNPNTFKYTVHENPELLFKLPEFCLQDTIISLSSFVESSDTSILNFRILSDSNEIEDSLNIFSLGQGKHIITVSQTSAIGCKSEFSDTLLIKLCPENIPFSITGKIIAEVDDYNFWKLVIYDATERNSPKPYDTVDIQQDGAYDFITYSGPKLILVIPDKASGFSPVFFGNQKDIKDAEVVNLDANIGNLNFKVYHSAINKLSANCNLTIIQTSKALKVKNECNEEKEIKIFDVTGRLIYENILKEGEEIYSESIGKGFYILNSKTEQYKFFIK